MSGSPRYTYGDDGKEPLMQVVSVDDPLQAGRVQVRIFGYQSDTAGIPDDQLFWANIQKPPTDASQGGIGGPGVGLVKGSWVTGKFADPAHRQQIMVTGSIGKAYKDGENGEQDNKDGNNDIPVAARDKEFGGGDKRLKLSKDEENVTTTEYDDKPITLYARDEAPNPHQRKQSKDADESPDKSFSIGGHQYA
jgi:Gp5 N-terminal OB domain